jgi:KipI family sensor histidine kinase inhibitor
MDAPSRSKRLFLSERGLILEYDNRIDPQINGRVRLMAAAIGEKKIPGVVNLMPTFRSLLVEYDPLSISLDHLNEAIDAIEDDLGDRKPPPGRYFELLTYYGEPYNYDTDRIAAHNGLSPEEVVRIFSEATLYIYMIGFIAALPNIGGLPECLHTPRLPSPRVLLPAGVVGLGGQQVAICPVDLPSGFNYIGRCFQKIYDPYRFPPCPYAAGDRIRFKAVSLEEAQAHQDEFPEPVMQMYTD